MSLQQGTESTSPIGEAVKDEHGEGHLVLVPDDHKLGDDPSNS